MAYTERISRRGVSLIELVMVIAVVGILATMSSGYINQVISTWQTVSFRMESVSQLRSAIDRMSREIRQVKNSTSVRSAAGNVFQFIDSGDAMITYNITGTNVLRNSMILVTNASRLEFAYYDAQGALLPAPQVYPLSTDIKRISITMEIRSSGQNKTMAAQVFPRNLGE
jgi:prepilin-type N-terminal cleavage/methylation domain-containing protein